MDMALAFTIAGTGITIENAVLEYTAAGIGNKYMTGTYTAGPMGSGSGMIMTNGLAIDALPPVPPAVNNPELSNIIGLPGSGLVDTMLGTPVFSYDAVTLTVTFSVNASVNSIVFDSLFGSDEYPKYRGQIFNDTFGVFLNGTAKSDQLVFDAAGDPVMINGLFFNEAGVIKEPATGTEYNGSTELLTTRAAIMPGSTGNVMKIIIADVGDRALDSGVLLSRFRGSDIIILSPGTQKSSPTNTPSPTPSPTITQTHTITPTHSVTPTITATPTVTETHTITETHTASPTFTATSTITPTPVDFILTGKGSYPSPFKDKTEIIYWLSRNAVVDVKIYTVSGEIARHDAGIAAVKGNNSFLWDGLNGGKAGVASGVYIYRIQAVSEFGEEAQTWGKAARVR
jgi:hypothetical protein